MCRWNAYIGEPLVIGELLYRTRHGLIDESLHARMGAETTNGDGFGVGVGFRLSRAPSRLVYFGSWPSSVEGLEA